MIKYPIIEGEIALEVPAAGKPCKTWYKIVGDLSTAIHPPLVTLHGGPGAGHEYLAPLIDLYQQHGIPIIFYDQIGCGRSTHLREKMGDTDFWTFDLFYHELDTLIDHLGLREKGFFLYGQSWGGMLGAAYACRQPVGLKKLIVSSGPASIQLAVKGIRRLIAQLPEDAQKAIEEGERSGNFESPEFEKAVDVFNHRHVCRIDPYPEGVLTGFKNLGEDPTVYATMQGPAEFVVIGSLKDWEGYRDAHKIEVEVLLLNGVYDEVTDISMQPWFQNIKKVRWVTLSNSSHMSHYEERERYMELCGSFLLG